MFKKTSIRRGALLAVALAAVHLAIVTGIPVAYAQAGFSTTGQGAQGNLNLTMVGIAQTLALLNTFMHVLLLLTLNMLEYLLEASFFTDPSMMSALNSIWVLSRNIMNLIFALMLIGVALYTIITADSKMITDKISTFIIAVILVNFSWFIPRVFIDVANVLTSAVYSVPDTLRGDAFGGTFACKDFNGNPCTAITDTIILIGKTNPAAAADTFCGLAANTPSCPCITGISCMRIENYDNAIKSTGRASAMLSGMLTSFIKIHGLTKVTASLAGDGGAGTTFTVTLLVLINILMTFFIQTVILFPLLGLAVGLFIRIMILWITISFMPFGFLGYVITGKFGTEVAGNTVDIKKEFINAAFLPVLVAIPMVIGFIMLSVMSKIPVPPGNMTWSVPLLAGFQNPWQLMWALAACAIIWIGTFTVLSRSKITGMFTDKIKGFGEGLLRAGSQIPLLIPLPVGPKGANIGSLVNAPKDLAREINVRARSQSIIPGQGGPAGGSGAVDPSAAAGALASNKTNTDNIVRAINELKNATGNDRSNAILNIQNTIGGKRGRSEAETLKDLKDVASNAKAPKELSDMIKQIEEEIAKKNK